MRHTRPDGVLSRKRALDQMRAPRTAKALVVVLATLFAAAILWAGRTEIQELAVAEGEIVPTGRLVYVEHFDGGVIEDVRVRQGDRVAAGQVMARLSSPEIGRTETELRQELSLLQAHGDLLRGLIGGSAPDDGLDAYAAARRGLHETQRAMLDERAASRRDALGIARNAREVALERLAIGEEELERLQLLNSKGYLPVVKVTAQRDLLQTIRGDILETETTLARAIADAADAKAAVIESDLAFGRELQQELFDVEQNVDRVEARLDEVRRRRARLTVTAPEAGLVQVASATTRGEVVDPGERMFEILPTSERLVAEVRVTPGDIGHLSVGHPVALKATAFDARRYGELHGHIATLSPTSILDPEGRPYFSAEVALDSTTLGTGAVRGEVMPGMIVIAEMETARRTILDYLLEPIEQSLEKSMHER